MTKPLASKTKATVWVVEKEKVRPKLDQLTTEEPLEIRLVCPQKTIAVTMRSPKADFELVVHHTKFALVKQIFWYTEFPL